MYELSEAGLPRADIGQSGNVGNGWLEWKTEQGQTLDGAKRQSVKVSE